MKKFIFRFMILALLVAGAWAGYHALQQLPSRQEQVATTKVRRSDVVVRSYARGELRAVRSVTLNAPNLFGTVQVTRLAPLGALAREKDLVVEFDDSEVISRVEEKQLELDQTDEQIRKAEADLATRNNQDQVDLLKARYAVRRAELEVKRNELLSVIDAQKNELTLKESRQRLSQLETDIKSRLEQAQAELAVLRANKSKGLLELAREKQRLLQVKLLAPMTGLVAIRQNRTGFFFSGMQIPDIREGDQLQPGIPVADVLDLSELEVIAKIGELDRANLREGQDVNIALDAVAHKTFHGKIKSMSGTASANVFSNDPQKKFDVLFSIDMRELLSALGAKPEQIQRVLATAEQNRKKPVPTMSSAPQMVAMPEMSAGPQAGAPETPGGMMPQAQPRRREGQGRPDPAEMIARLTSNLPADQQKKAQAAIQKLIAGKNLQEMSGDDRRKLFGQIREEIAKFAPKSDSGGPPQVGFRRPDAPSAPGGPGAAPQGATDAPLMGFSRPQQFSEKDMANAKLPPPPEEDSQLDVLIRPGLLVDVEIIIEKIQNALNVPAQAVFERQGKNIVFVKNGNKFDEREVKPLKRSESTMVIASGLNSGEVIAMADPTAKKGDKKKDKPAGNPMGNMGSKGGA